MRQQLAQRLANHRNRLARFYDNGGSSYDRYVAAYLQPSCDQWDGSTWFWYRAMSGHPCSPAGVGIASECRAAPIDFPPVALDRNHPRLGRRVGFASLPPDVQRSVLEDLSPSSNS